MKKLVILLAMMALAGVSMAQTVMIERNDMGSGTPGLLGQEVAVKWGNDISHAPQYMPGYPTAATLFPRVVDVPCTKTASGVVCGGYSLLPEMGRGEYLLFRPVVVKESEVKVVEKIVPVPAPYAVPGPARIVLKEVPAKPIKE